MSNLLALYAAGLLGYAAYSVLVRAFYSRQNARSPALLNVLLFLLYTALAFSLSGVFGLPGVALAFSLAYAVLALLCLLSTREELRHLDGRRLLRSLSKVLVAGAVMYLTARAGVALLGNGSGIFERSVVVVVAGGVSLAAYLATALLMEIEEMSSIGSLVKSRRFSGQARPTKPDTSGLGRPACTRGMTSPYRPAADGTPSTVTALARPRRGASSPIRRDPL